MQIFNKENGHEVVYVQYEDLYFLEQNGELPKFILDEIDAQETVGTKLDDGREKFYVKFTSHFTVQFFKSLSVLIDYKKEKNKSLRELYEEGEKINKILETIRKDIFDVNKDEYQRQEALRRMKFLSYRAQGLEEIYLSKLNKEPIALPECIDSDGFNQVIDDFVVNSSIDGNKLFISRKDKEKLDELDISLDIIEISVKEFLLYKGEEYPNPRNIYYSYCDLTDDNHTMIIEYTIYHPPVKKINILEKILRKFS